MNISSSSNDPDDARVHRPVTGRSLRGHLHLECSARADGVPYLSKQDFRVPIHIGKGMVEEGVLVVHLANPTAGFFDGDHVDIRVVVRPGAQLCLSTPAAARVYSTRSGKPAASSQHLTVCQGGLLEWMPEPLIPHRGASYRQSTTIHLEKQADLLFLEWLTPGRVAMGEVFFYQNLRWELDVIAEQRLVARERYHVRPDGAHIESLRARFPTAHYVSLYAAGIFAASWPGELLDGLDGNGVNLGHGPLEGGVMVVRALCRDSMTARTLVSTLRSLLYRAAGRVPPSLGRMPD